ncbi:hypothetical protein [Maricaulis sp.]|uniref:hypothetical protein n=1 Tax=Maricaulis sp. TaxID=1486257 RepID=UPI00260711E0|nr:hypothetical protein [Maricaulis sp.]
MKAVSVLFAAASLLTAPAALAQNAHPLLDAALARGLDETEASAWRYTVTATTQDGVMVGRFDGAQPIGQEWTLVSPAEADLSDFQSEIWTGFSRRGENADEAAEGYGSGLFFSVDDSDIVPGSFSLAEEAADLLVFSFEPQLEGNEEIDMAEHLSGALTVSRDPAVVTQLRMWAPESFKPHFAVRLNTLDIVQEFTQLDGMPAPVLTRLSQTIRGSAAFQEFDQSFELVFSEIEYSGPVE